MSKRLPAVILNFIEDALTLAGGAVPTATLRGRVDTVLQRRRQAAREILLTQLREGNITVSDAAAEDEFIAMLVEYRRAVDEGSAKLNLKLIAQVMRGILRARPIRTSAFIRWSRIIAEMSHEEILVLASLHKHCVGDGQKTMNELDLKSTAQDRVEQELVPKYIASQDRLRSILTALTRTGLVSLFSGVGTLIYRTSSDMTQVAGWADFEHAFHAGNE